MADDRRRLFMFLGAGASVAANVPHTKGLLKDFRTSVAGDEQLRPTLAWVEKHVETWASRVPASRQVDVESVLEAISFLTDGRQVGQAFVRPDTSAEADPQPSADNLRALMLAFLAYIREKCLVPPSAAGAFEGFAPFLLDYQELHLFTVNYDIVIEQMLGRFRVEFVDGFRLRWEPELFDVIPKDDRSVFVYKLHGSATWFRSTLDNYIRLPVRTPSNALELTDLTHAVPLMMYPARKWDYSGPFLDLLSQFRATLESSSCTWLVVVGFTFRDQHLNRVIRDAATRNPNLRIVLISPHAQSIYADTLVHPGFGWTEDDRPEENVLPYSPLAGRVVAIPFLYERVLPDFAQQTFAKLRHAVEYYDSTRINALRLPGQNWSTVADLLVQSGVVDQLADVEKRGQLESGPEQWRINYLASKAVVLWTLGITAEASKLWQHVEDTWADWFKTRVEANWESAPDRFGIGINLDALYPPALKRDRHALSTISQIMEPTVQMIRRYDTYLEGDARRTWLRGCLGKLTRLADYCRAFQSNVKVEEYFTQRRVFDSASVDKLASLLVEWRLPESDASTGTGNPTRRETIGREFLEEVRSLEERYVLSSVIPDTRPS